MSTYAFLLTGIDGLRVLDLGSGSGRDCYAAAALVGEGGSVTGIDMTAEQIEVCPLLIILEGLIFKHRRFVEEFEEFPPR